MSGDSLYTFWSILVTSNRFNMFSFWLEFNCCITRHECRVIRQRSYVEPFLFIGCRGRVGTALVEVGSGIELRGCFGRSDMIGGMDGVQLFETCMIIVWFVWVLRFS